jgi:hypothetical protein
MKFAFNNKTYINLNIGYGNKTFEEMGRAKFLALQIVDNLENTLNIYFKFSLLCLLPFHYVIQSYLLGKFNREQKVFNIQKRTIRIMAGVKKSVSC